MIIVSFDNIEIRNTIEKYDLLTRIYGNKLASIIRNRITDLKSCNNISELPGFINVSFNRNVNMLEISLDGKCKLVAEPLFKNESDHQLSKINRIKLIRIECDD